MLRKIILAFLVIFLVFPLFVEARYTICTNRTMSSVYNQGQGIRFNNSDTFFVPEPNDDKIYVVNDSSLKVITNFSTITHNYTSIKGLALNRSRLDQNVLWFTDVSSESIVRYDFVLNRTFNITPIGFTLPEGEGIDTLDGSRWYLIDSSRDRLIVADSTFTYIDEFDITNYGIGSPNDLSLQIENNAVQGFWIYDDADDVVYHLNVSFALIEQFNLRLTQDTFADAGFTSYDNVTYRLIDPPSNRYYNFTNDVAAPTLNGVRINDSFYQAGDTITFNFDSLDNCGNYVSYLTVNETGIFKNKSSSADYLLLNPNFTTSITYEMNYSNLSVCSRDIGFRLVINDTAGNTNISTLNFTTAYPLMLGFQTNTTESWNCSAVTSQNFTYTFGASSWVNFTINMSVVGSGGNVSCPYIALGAELTNITVNASGGCLVRALNRKYTGSTITFQLYQALSATGTSNLPAAIAVATIASIIVAVTVARAKRN